VYVLPGQLQALISVHGFERQRFQNEHVQSALNEIAPHRCIPPEDQEEEYTSPTGCQDILPGELPGGQACTKVLLGFHDAPTNAAPETNAAFFNSSRRFTFIMMWLLD
jgi:hypothetical protein